MHTTEPTTTRAASVWPNRERARLYAALQSHRAERAAGLTMARHRAERSTEPSALESGARSGRDRRASDELAAARQRDEATRALRFPLSGEALLSRVWTGVERAGAALKANPDELSETLGWLMLKTVEQHGTAPLAVDVPMAWLEQRARGHILNDRERVARRLARQHDDDATEHGDDEPRTAEEKIAALAHRAGGSVWAVAQAPTESAHGTEAEVLAERLGALTGRALSASERSALLAALAGYGSGREYAAAEGISEGAARKRMHDGRAALLRRFPDPDALADAIADARRIGADDAPRVDLSAAERAAEWVVTEARHRTYKRPARSAARGRYGTAGATSRERVDYAPAPRRSTPQSVPHPRRMRVWRLAPEWTRPAPRLSAVAPRVVPLPLPPRPARIVPAPSAAVLAHRAERAALPYAPGRSAASGR